MTRIDLKLLAAVQLPDCVWVVLSRALTLRFFGDERVDEATVGSGAGVASSPASWRVLVRLPDEGAILLLEERYWWQLDSWAILVHPEMMHGPIPRTAKPRVGSYRVSLDVPAALRVVGNMIDAERLCVIRRAVIDNVRLHRQKSHGGSASRRRTQISSYNATVGLMVTAPDSGSTGSRHK